MLLGLNKTTLPPRPNTTCSANQVFKSCGTACPETCEGRSFACTRQCVIGCQCAAGYVKHNDTCITRAQCPGLSCRWKVLPSFLASLVNFYCYDLSTGRTIPLTKSCFVRVMTIYDSLHVQKILIPKSGFWKKYLRQYGLLSWELTWYTELSKHAQSSLMAAPTWERHRTLLCWTSLIMCSQSHWDRTIPPPAAQHSSKER